MACQLRVVTSKALTDCFPTQSVGTTPRSLRVEQLKCATSPINLAIRGLQPLFNESRSPTTMAEVLPQIRVRADTQSREASFKVETPTVLPLTDATNNTGNGRIISPESVEGETPSQLPAFSNMAQPITAKMLAQLLTLLSSTTVAKYQKLSRQVHADHFRQSGECCEQVSRGGGTERLTSNRPPVTRMSQSAWS